MLLNFRYNFSNDDNELYKEMMDIVCNLIPKSMKKIARVNQSMLNNSECYAYVLLIYDGLCLWVEGGSTLVLHIKWANHFLKSISKFNDSARTRLTILELNVRQLITT